MGITVGIMGRDLNRPGICDGEQRGITTANAKESQGYCDGEIRIVWDESARRTKAFCLTPLIYAAF